MIPHSKPSISKEDFSYIDRILKAGQIARGPLVAELEEAVAARVGMRHGLATSSGLAALHLTAAAHGMGEQSEIIMPSLCCTAPFHAFAEYGARPRLCDVDSETGNPTVDTVKAALTKRTHAIVVTHTCGHPADIRAIGRLGPMVIEDCAQALGARIGKRPAGAFGDTSIFSFYATKMICSGEGGMVCVNQRLVKRRLRDLNTYDGREDLREIRYNYKMSDLAAGLALSQLRRLDGFLARRRAIAERYLAAFADLPVAFQKILPGTTPSWYRFILLTPRAATVRAFLRTHGIAAERPVFKPLHRYFGIDPAKFSGTERFWRDGVSIPIYPALTEREVLRVIATVRRAFGKPR